MAAVFGAGLHAGPLAKSIRLDPRLVQLQAGFPGHGALLVGNGLVVLMARFQIQGHVICAPQGSDGNAGHHDRRHRRHPRPGIEFRLRFGFLTGCGEGAGQVRALGHGQGCGRG
jgi:hypothetical protein